jgi:ABC-type spermidine/putrescine transport system permease subunit II
VYVAIIVAGSIVIPVISMGVPFLEMIKDVPAAQKGLFTIVAASSII